MGLIPPSMYLGIHLGLSVLIYGFVVVLVIFVTCIFDYFRHMSDIKSIIITWFQLKDESYYMMSIYNNSSPFDSLPMCPGDT